MLVALIVTFPGFLNSTSPLSEIEATFASVVSHVTKLLASIGSTLIDKDALSPTHFNPGSIPSIFKLVGAALCKTVTSTSPYAFESIFNVALIFTVPALIPVTTPFSLTEATVSSLELQVTSFSVVPVTLALNCNVLLALIVVEPIALTTTLYWLTGVFVFSLLLQPTNETLPKPINKEVAKVKHLFIFLLINISS